jgi:DNA-binding MurR/RpiR family transcriptional regulator
MAETMLDLTLEARINAVFDQLSGQLQRAARFVADHPAEVAMHSMRRIAEEAGVAPATMLRLARRLGLQDYDSLRSICLDRVRDSAKTIPFSRRGRALQARGGAGGGGGLAADMLAAETQNLERTLNAAAGKRLDAAVALLAEAQRVFLIARRSCYPVACCFHYAYSLFRQNGVLLEDRAGCFAPELLGIGRGDVLLAISFEPYSIETIAAVETARTAGAHLVAVTDTEFSPLARVSEVTLIAGNGSPAFLQSITAATALVQALAIGVFVRAGRQAVVALEQKEARLRAGGAYWEGRPALGGRPKARIRRAGAGA